MSTVKIPGIRWVVTLVLVLPGVASGVVAGSRTPAPRTVVVYSSWANSGFKEGERAAFKANGWDFDTVENRNLPDLVKKLEQYDIVILTACYNLVNTQPFGNYAEQWRKFIAEGGVLLVMDFESDPPGGISWVSSIDPRFAAKPSGKFSEYATQKPAWISGHPLMKGGSHYPGGAAVQELCWTYWGYVSPDYTPLVKDSAGRALLAVQSFGQGLIVISTLYSGTAFPDAAFVWNLWEYAKDSHRMERDSRPRMDRGLLSEIEFGKLTGRPRLSAGLDEPAWVNAGEFKGFKSGEGKASENQTRLRAGMYGSDLYLRFSCSGRPTVVAELKRDDPRSQFGDCVEIYSEPANDGPQRRFVVSASGAMLDEQDSDPAWSGWWQASTDARPDGWQAVVRLPLATLGAGEKGWAVNFARSFPARDDRPESRVWLFPTYPESIRVQGMAQVITPKPSAPPVAVSCSSRDQTMNPGPTTLEVSVGNAGNAAVDGVLSLEPVDGENGVLGTASVGLAGQDTKTIPLPVTFPAGRSTRFQLVLRKGEDVLASSPIYSATGLDYLDLSLIRPNYRNLVQSQDKVKQVQVSCMVRPPHPGKYLVRLTARIRGDAKATGVVERKVGRAGKYTLSMDASGWKPGRYELAVSFSELGADLLAEQTAWVQVGKPAKLEVSFGFNGAAYVNGKPFFPIGLYDISREQMDLVNEQSQKAGLPTRTMREMISQVKGQGFNLGIMGDGFPKDDMLQMADELGFYLVPSGVLVDKEEVRSRVRKAREHQCILAWYGVDEMSDAFDYVNRSMEAYSLWREADPYRPVISAVQNWNPSLVVRILKGLDILMPDHYPIPLFPMERVPMGVAEAANHMRNRAALWVVPQAWKWTGSRIQTWQETRWIAYASIACGAQGLIWYTYQCAGAKHADSTRGCWYLPDYPELWNGFRQLNAEIRSLSLPILEGRVRTDIKAPDGVYFRAIEHRGNLYLIAASGSKAVKPASITGPGLAGTFDVIGEKRSIKASGGVLKDNFQPYTAYIYVGKE